jgi:hypothetical protein
MKKTFVFAALGIFCASVLFAADGDAKAEVKAAAKKLGDKGNYSWTSTPKSEGGGGGGGNFRPGPTEGQTADGIVYLKNTFGDRTMEVAAKGEKILVKGDDGWESAEDAQGPAQFASRRMRTFKAPAAEAADLADKTTSLKKADGVISGDLTEEGAKALLTFGRGRQGAGNAPAPKDAKGDVKFWTKDGELSKYEYHVQGKITGRDDNEVAVNRTTTVEIKDAGKTKLSLSDETKKKL